MSIGSRIKQRREELGLTQPELAKLIGVSKGTIGNYETGLSAPNEKNFFKLFEVLKCDANFLYQDEMLMIDKDTITNDEKKIIKKYRSLDAHGKKLVDCVLNLELDRCNTNSTDKNITIQPSEMVIQQEPLPKIVQTVQNTQTFEKIARNGKRTILTDEEVEKLHELDNDEPPNLN